MKIGIIAAEFNFDIGLMMVEQAKRHAEFLGVDIGEVVFVPGVFDIPLAVKALLKKEDVDGVVTLGAVIEGETKHDEVIMQHAARKIEDLGIEYEKPVALGISGPGMTRLQAEDRIEKAKGAVEAVVKMYRALEKLRK
ncbi:MAG: 6,7-dimethyl-8-ribityllumazine synthase [Candidatus Thermoplasmatota archaeon]